MQTGYTLDYSTIKVDDECDNADGDCNGDGSRDVSQLVIQEIEQRGEASLTSSFGTSLTYDKRNNAKNPTSGYYMQVSTDFAGARRRRSVRARQRRRPRLLPDHGEASPSSAASSAATSRAGAATTSA